MTEVEEKAVPGATVSERQWHQLDRPARPQHKLNW